MNENPNKEPEIIENEYDSAIVVDDAEKTVLLTEQETIVVEKEKMFSVVPKNRPRKVYGGMWGAPEITAVGLGLLMILAAILFFALFVLPKQREFENSRAKRDRLEQEKKLAEQKYGDITNTETQVAKLIASVDDFETRFLKPSSISQPAVYQQINGLIAAYGLVNTTGPDYSPLEIIERGKSQQQERERGKAKFQSLFPGDYVSVTVEGSYQNLRRFIRGLETSNQFIVIAAVELEGAENKERKETNQVAQQQPSPNQPVNDPRFVNFPNPINPTNSAQTTKQPKVERGKTRGEIVALRLELATYYRRPNFQPMEISKPEER